MPKPMGRRSSSVRTSIASSTDSAKLMTTPRLRGTAAGPPRGPGPAWERPGARPGLTRLTLDSSQMLLPVAPEQSGELDHVLHADDRDEQHEGREHHRERHVEHRRLLAVHEAD